MGCLNNSTLVLLLIHPVVLPNRNSRDAQGQNGGGRNGAIPLALPPGVVDGVSSRRAHGVRNLGEIAAEVDLVHLVGHVLGNPGAKGFRKGARVNGDGDGVANGATNAGEQVEHSEHHGDAVAVAGGHDGHAVANDNGAAAKRDEDLAHDDVANVRVLAAEMNHQTGAENHERQAEAEDGPLEVLGVLDPEAKDDAPEAGADVVNLRHVAGVAVAEVVHDEDEAVKVEVPRVEAEVGQGGHAAGAQDGPLPKELPPDKVRAGEPLLPGGKDGEQHDAGDDHGDEGGAAVGGAAVADEAEGQQEEDKGGHEDDGADDVELVEIVDDGLERGPAARLVLVDAQALGLLLVELEDDGQGHEDEGLDDGEAPNGPAPGAVPQEGLGGQRAREGGADEGRRHKGEGKGAVLQARRVGDEDVQDEVDGVVADPVEDVAGGVTVGPAAGRQDDHAKQVDAEKDQVALGTAPDVERLGDGQLQDPADDVGQDRGRGDGRRRREVGIRRRRDVEENGLLESQHEEAEPDPAHEGPHRLLGPDEGGGLGLLDTKLGAGRDLLRMLLDFPLVLLLEAGIVGVAGERLLAVVVAGPRLQLLGSVRRWKQPCLAGRPGVGVLGRVHLGSGNLNLSRRMVLAAAPRTAWLRGPRASKYSQRPGSAASPPRVQPHPEDCREFLSISTAISDSLVGPSWSRDWPVEAPASKEDLIRW
ncbi:hypothetical protein E5D57_012965 [Metarhizium anisopliae]|nr:hypothetical protein E5D57_012965 [Metarhizium anisopliae]